MQRLNWRYIVKKLFAAALASFVLLGTMCAQSGANALSGKRVLVAYYSATNTTKNVAERIASYTGATLFEIVPAQPYSSADLNYRNSSSRVNREHNDSSRRVALASTTVPNFASYDVVFIGYPIWWGEAAWVLDEFVKNNDFSGKTVVPFCTSISSPLGQSDKNLARLAGTGNWLDGRRFGSRASDADIRSWIDGLRF